MTTEQTKLLTKLNSIVTHRMKKINAELSAKPNSNVNETEFDDIIKILSDEPTTLKNPEFLRKIIDIVENTEEPNEKTLQFKKTVKYLSFLFEILETHKDKTLKRDEIAALNEVIYYLKECKTKKEEQIKKERELALTNPELEKCQRLHKKLSNGDKGTEHFFEDLQYLNSLIEGETIEFKKEVLLLIQYLTKKIHDNIIAKIDEEEFVPSPEIKDEEDITNEIKLDEDLLVQTFKKYGFDYYYLTEKHRLVYL